MINWVGPLLGVICLLGVWSGHILVRKLDFHLAKVRPVAVFMGLLGCCTILSTLWISNTILAGILGVAGMILFFDAIELFLQEKRVRIGHAAANPANPRHQKILQSSNDSVIYNPLDQVDAS